MAKQEKQWEADVVAMLDAAKAELEQLNLGDLVVSDSRIGLEWIEQDGAVGLVGVVDVQNEQDGAVGQFEVSRHGDYVVGVRGDALNAVLTQTTGQQREAILALYAEARSKWCATDEAWREVVEAELQAA